MTNLVNQMGLGIILEAQGNLSKETLAAARNLGLLEQAGNRAGNVITGQTRAMSGAIGTLKQGLGALPGLIASIAGGFSAWQAIKLPIDFEHSVARLRATIMSTVTDTDIAIARVAQWGSRIQDVAKYTGRDAKEIAVAVGQLYAELGEEGAKNALGPFSEMLRAGIPDAMAAVNSLTVLMNTFNEAPKKIGDMAMQVALNTGTTLGEITGIMSENATLYKAMGWSLEDLAELSGMVKTLGLTGLQARTLLRQGPMNLMDYDERRREAKKGAGSITDYLTGGAVVTGFQTRDASGQLLSMLGVAKNAASYIGYKAGQGELTPAQKTKLTESGVNKEFLLQLTSIIPKIEKMGTSTENAEGALAKFAAKYMKDTQSSFDQLGESSKSLVGEITDGLLPAFKALTDQATKAADGLRGYVAGHPATGAVGTVLGLAGAAWIGKKILAWAGGGLGRMFGGGGGAATAGEAATGGTASVAGGMAMPVTALIGAAALIVDDTRRRKHWTDLGRNYSGIPLGSPINRRIGTRATEWLFPERNPMQMDYRVGISYPIRELPDLMTPEDTAPREDNRDYSTQKFQITINQLPGQSGTSLASQVVKAIREKEALAPGGRN